MTAKAHSMRFDDLQGQQLGRYEIRGLLGRGGMAAVYRALDTALQREIALKVLYSHYLSDEEQITRFQREAVVAASLDHPNIVQIYDVGNEHGLIYIAMQLLPGRTLGDLLRERGSLPLAELAPIVDQVASALDYAHARGIIHRDIKPANILLDSEGRALLTDFGIAKLLDTPGLTTTSVILGTPDYMAPEQISNQPVDGRVDIYALGVLVFRALSGRRPFEGSTDQVLLGHIHGVVPNVSAYASGLPAGIDGVVQQAMARRPEDRYQAASALAADLRTVAGLAPLRPVRGSAAPIVAPVIAANSAPTLRSPGRNNDAATLRGTPAVAQPPLVAAGQSEPARWNRLLWPLLLGLILVAGGGGFVLARTLNANDAGVGVVPTEFATTTPAPTAALATTQPAPTSAPVAPTVAPSAEPTVVPSAEPTVAPSAEPTVAPTVRPTAAPTVRPTAAPATAAPLPSAQAPTAQPPTATSTAIPLLAVFKPIYDADLAMRQRLGLISEAADDLTGAEQPFEVGSMLWAGKPDETIYVLFNDNTWNRYPKALQKGSDTPPAATPGTNRYVPVGGFGTVWSTHSELPITLGLATALEMNTPFAYQRFLGGEMLYSANGLGNGKTVYVLFNDNAKYQEFPVGR